MEQATPDQSFACQVVGLGALEAPPEGECVAVFIINRAHCTRVVVGGSLERMSFVPRLALIGLRQPCGRTLVSQVPAVRARLDVRCTAVAESQRARGCRAQGNTTSGRRSVAEEVLRARNMGDATILYERAGGACLALISEQHTRHPSMYAFHGFASAADSISITSVHLYGTVQYATGCSMLTFSSTLFSHCTVCL